MNRKTKLPLQFAVALGLAFGISNEVPLASAQDSTPTQPDNSKVNKEDRGKTAITADNQKNGKSDRDMTAQIRKAIVGDKTFSIYAHNIKIITRNGRVFLKGPVRSDDEKAAIEKAAADVAGPGNVTNQLTVAPGKS
jgi:hyperosmotically inducible protein